MWRRGHRGKRGVERNDDQPTGIVARYALFCYNHPFATFFTSVLALLAIAAIAGNSLELADGNGDEWFIKDHEHTKRDQAIEEALHSLGQQVNEWERSDDSDMLSLVVIYKAKDAGKNVFTQENLESIRTVENLVLMHPKYKEVCQINYTSPSKPCMKPISPLALFYDYNASDPGFSGPQLQQDISEGLAELRRSFFTNSFFVDKTFPVTNTSEVTRSKFFLGLPIKGFENSKTDKDKQEEEVLDGFLKDLEQQLWDLLDMNAGLLRTHYSDTGHTGNLEVVFGNEILANAEMERVVWMDFGWAAGAILFLWVYMLIHLGSLFLATVGIFEVFMAFPLALFFYRLVFQIEFFNEVNFLVIFILLGIGADDVFVFADAFKQSPAIPGVGHCLKARLMYCTKRASKAIFVTNFTTMAAFFATAISSLMPMQAFGIFAALCIIFLFLINVVIMPPALVLWSGYSAKCVQHVCCCFAWLHKTKCCTEVKSILPCCTCCHYELDETLELPVIQPANESTGNRDSISNNADSADLPATDNPVDGVKEQEMVSTQAANLSDKTLNVEKPVVGDPPREDITKLRKLERFYNGPYFSFIKKTRWIFIVLGVAVFGVGLGFATQFEAPNEAEQWWPSSHAHGKFFKYIDRTGPFMASKDDWIAPVHLVWGLKEMDTGGISKWDATDFGELEYDDTFDLTSEEAQLHMLGVCDQVRKGKCKVSAEECKRGEGPGEAGYLVLLDRTSDVPLEKQAPCWIEEMDAWLNKTGKGLPLPREEFMTQLINFRESPEGRLKYQEHIGVFDENGEQRLKFVQFEFASTYRPPAPYSRTIEVIESWEDLVSKLNKDAADSGAEGVSRGFVSGRVTWSWIFTQNLLLRNAIQGILLVFAIAFVVLNMATGNLVVSIIASVTLIGIVSTVMGIGIQGIMGWKMGIAESVVSVILIGFAMDYSLHLADSYVESERPDRAGRTQDALTHLGISVTAGAITTLGSGLFLWGGVMLFFRKFAFNITATILASFLWSMLFFPSLCLTVGPEGDFGNWRKMIGHVFGS